MRLCPLDKLSGPPPRCEGERDRCAHSPGHCGGVGGFQALRISVGVLFLYYFVWSRGDGISIPPEQNVYLMKSKKYLSVRKNIPCISCLVQIHNSFLFCANIY